MLVRSLEIQLSGRFYQERQLTPDKSLVLFDLDLPVPTSVALRPDAATCDCQILVKHGPSQSVKARPHAAPRKTPDRCEVG